MFAFSSSSAYSSAIPFRSTAALTISSFVTLFLVHCDEGIVTVNQRSMNDAGLGWLTVRGVLDLVEPRSIPPGHTLSPHAYSTPTP